MLEPIRFYFEFASPCSYLASLLIEPAAQVADRSVSWRPIDLPRVWQAQGVLEAYATVRKLKGPHIRRDAARCAARLGMPFKAPRSGVSDTGLAKRAYCGLSDNDDMRATPFLRAVWHRHFGEGREIAALDDLAEAAAPLGLSAADIDAAAAIPEAAARIAANNEEATAAGCFGVPWFVADGESFFGHDRVPHLVDFLTMRP